MSLLRNFPTAIPIPYITAETVVQAFLQNGHATFGDSLTLITDNVKDLKNFSAL